MDAQLTNLVKRASKLPATEREAIARRLLESAGETKLTKFEEAWVEEAERRFEAIKLGEGKVTSLASAMRQARKVITR
ncbi:MAG: addiction module protein [Candidatus Sumerlaeaceae bacterium]